MIVYVVLIIAFTYFMLCQVNPEKWLITLKKQGSYVPGIRPGEQTKIYY